MTEKKEQNQRRKKLRTRRKEKEIKNKEARVRKGEGKDRKHMENSMMGNKNDRRGGIKSSEEIITIIIIRN